MQGKRNTRSKPVRISCLLGVHAISLEHSTSNEIQNQASVALNHGSYRSFVVSLSIVAENMVTDGQTNKHLKIKYRNPVHVRRGLITSLQMLTSAPFSNSSSTTAL